MTAERTILRIPTRVVALEPEYRRFNWRKEGNDTRYDQELIGWFVLFAGSRERMLVGLTKPDNLNVGDTVFIDIVKPDAARNACNAVS